MSQYALVSSIMISLIALSMPIKSVESGGGSKVATANGASAPVTRFSDSPILKPRPDKFDSAGAFNPAAIKKGKQYILIYRGQNTAGTSSLGLAESKDGISFIQHDKPLLAPETDYEKDGGLEDPRIVRFGKLYYLTYTGYNKKDAQLCLASSPDLKSWTRHGVIMPAYKGSWNKGWTKAGAIVDRKIHGKYWMYYLGTADGGDQMGVATSTDLISWKDASDRPVLAARPGMFDSKVVEPGPPPLITKDGILMFYNGADDKLVYRTGWVIFDKNDPSKVIARSDKPVFEPQKDWELKGQVPNVVFVEGLIRQGNRLLLYYGGADTVTGVAQTQLNRPGRND